MRQVALVLAAVLLAGCAELPYDPDPAGGGDATGRYRLGGSFTNDRTDADIEAWCEIAREYGNECTLMESYPEQFSLGFATLADCNDARDRLAAMERVRPGSCAGVSVPHGDPDAPTSASDEPAAPASYPLHGTFLRSYTQRDLDLWCEIAHEVEQTCALMTSEPPQFKWSFAELDGCTEARFRLQRVQNLSTSEC